MDYLMVRLSVTFRDLAGLILSIVAKFGSRSPLAVLGERAARMAFRVFPILPTASVPSLSSFGERLAAAVGNFSQRF
jgi:hypothetical protein